VAASALSASVLIPFDVAHGSLFRIGVSAALKTDKIGEWSPTTFDIIGSIDVTSPEAGNGIRTGGARRLDVAWTGRNVDGCGVLVQLCYSAELGISEVHKGTCVNLKETTSTFLSANGESQSIRVELPSSPSIINVQHDWAACVTAVYDTTGVVAGGGKTSWAVDCSPALLLKATIDIVSLSVVGNAAPFKDVDVKGGDTLEMRFLTSWLTGVVQIKLCSDRTGSTVCDSLLVAVDLSESVAVDFVHTVTMVLPVDGDHPSGDGYRIQAVSTSLSQDAVDISDPFEIKPSLSIIVAGGGGALAGSTLRGGDAVTGISIVVTNKVSLEIHVRLCYVEAAEVVQNRCYVQGGDGDGSADTVEQTGHSTATPLQVSPISAGESLILTGGKAVAISVTLPEDLPLQRDTYFLMLAPANPTEHAVSVSSSPQFTVIVNAAPVVASVSIFPSKIYRTTPNVECRSSTVTDEDPEHANIAFSMTTTWSTKSSASGNTAWSLVDDLNIGKGSGNIGDVPEDRLKPGALDISDLIRCTMQASDGIDPSLEVLSSSVKIDALTLVDTVIGSAGATSDTVRIHGDAPDAGAVPLLDCEFSGSSISATFQPVSLSVITSATKVSETEVKCDPPVWDYRPNSAITVFLRDRNNNIRLSSSVPFLEFRAKIPNAPAILSIGAKMNSSVYFQWRPSKYADSTIEQCTGFLVEVFRVDASENVLEQFQEERQSTWANSMSGVPNEVEITAIEGLLASSRYQFSIKMMNDVGISEASEKSAIAETTAAVAPAMPDRVLVPFDSITESSCVLKWGQGHNGGSPISKFGIEVSIEDGSQTSCTRSWEGVCDVSSGTCGANLQCTVSVETRSATCNQLAGNTKYMFRVYAVNAADLQSEASPPSPTVQTIVLEGPVLIDPDVAHGDSDICVGSDPTVGGTQAWQPCASLAYATHNRRGSSRQLFKLKSGVVHTVQTLNDTITFTNLPHSVVQPYTTNDSARDDTVEHDVRVVIDCSDAARCFDTVIGTHEGQANYPWFPSQVSGIHFKRGLVKDGSAGAALRIGLPVTSVRPEPAIIPYAVSILNCDITDHRVGEIADDSAKTTTGGGGAAVAVYHAEDVRFVNVTFHRNQNLYAKGKGGALGIFSSRVTLTGVSFRNNMAPNSGSGGALVSLTTAAEVRTSVKFFSKCVFEGNVASGGFGGAALFEASDVQFISTILERNTATVGGGAISAKDSSLILDSTILRGNTAGTQDGNRPAAGGAIDCLASNIRSDGSVFDGNAAQSSTDGYGGALASLYCGLSLHTTTFVDNVASHAGGSLRLTAYSTLLVSQSKFLHSVAGTHGGGMHLDQMGELPLIKDSEFNNCTSARTGGCIFVQKTPDIALRSTTLSNCVALGSGGGGGVFLTESVGVMEMTGVIVADCEAKTGPGGGVMWLAGSDTTSDASSPVARVRMDEFTRTSASDNVAAGHSSLAVSVASSATTLKFKDETVFGGGEQDHTDRGTLGAQSSGKIFAPAPVLEILDFYGETVTTTGGSSSGILVTAFSPDGDQLSYQGGASVPLEASSTGFIDFAGLAVFQVPGSQNVRVSFKSRGLVAEEASMVISLRKCKAGERISSQGKECQLCDEGKFSEQENAASCLKCPPGKVASEAGSVSCFACGEGTYADQEGLVACKSCNPGKFAGRDNPTIGNTACTPCTEGRFSGKKESGSCGSCGVGSFSKEGSTACTLCAPGFASQSYEAGACEPCNFGYESPITGATTCVPCISGRYGTDDVASGTRKCVRTKRIIVVKFGWKVFCCRLTVSSSSCVLDDAVLLVLYLFVYLVSTFVSHVFCLTCHVHILCLSFLLSKNSFHAWLVALPKR
jgi:predicted outer membrane repeat protein